MKVMAGYDTRHKTDYRAKAAEEVAKVQQKARILEEMLQNHKDGEKIGDGDVFEVRWSHRSQNVTDGFRNWSQRFKAPTQKSRRCARKSLTMLRPSQNYSRSMTVYTAR